MPSLFFAVLLLTTPFAFGNPENLSLAPASFEVEGKRAVPINIISEEVSITFDAAAKTNRATAVVIFQAEEKGYPILDLVPNAKEARLGGEVVSFEQIRDPDQESYLRMVGKEVRPLVNYRFEVDYSLNKSDITYTDEGVRIGFFTSDVDAANQQGFLEQYAPANYEYDQFPLTVNLEIVNGGSSHQVFTNGQMSQSGRDQWRVEFPSYFTASSAYLHLTNREMAVREGTYSGLKANIPYVVYSESASQASSGESKLKKILKELEGTYGPFAHERIVAYITNYGGGMEYCGATITDLWALEHEFTHFWFARGVMPANGNAGWIDEAVASWRDDGYKSSSSDPSWFPVKLASFSPYHRMTPRAAYSSGSRLMSRFDHEFEIGLKPVLKALFAEKQRQVITTPFFKDFLEGQTGADLTELFDRFVYNKQRPGDLENFSPVDEALNHSSRHPRPFSEDELRKIR